MSQLWQLKALLKKNYILMKRSCCASLCEIFFPIILMILISMVRRAIKVKDYSFDGNELEFLKSNSTALVDFSTVMKEGKLNMNGNQTEIYWKNMSFYYPLSICFNRPTIGIVGKKEDEIVQRLTVTLGKLRPKSLIPSFPLDLNLKFKYFLSQDEMNNYVKNEAYGSDETISPELCFGINLQRKSESDFSYSLSYFDSIIRNSISNVPSTLKKSLDPFQIGPDISSYAKWISSGYLYMMKLANSIILQVVTNNPNASINLGVINQKFESFTQDPFANFLGFMLPFFLVIAYICPLCILVFRMVKEKETRAKEGMRIMGMKDLVYFLSYFIQYLIINTITSLLNSIVLTRVLKNVSFPFIFGFNWLYGMNVFSLGYFFQAIMDRTRIAMIVSILIYFIMFFVSVAVISEDVSNAAKMLMSLLPPTTLQLGINVLAKFETSYLKFTSEYVSFKFNNYSVSNMYSMFVLNFFIYLFLGFYLENVLSHQFGIKKPFYFLCTKSYWCKSRSNQTALKSMQMQELNKRNNNLGNESNAELKRNEEQRRMKDANDLNRNNQDHFEDESKYESLIKAGECLSIVNLQKKFGEKKKALDGLNLNFYKNEVFALLGHNGAGKSTTISILCGLYEADSGEAYFKNSNVLETSNVSTFRQKLGICPQHDVLFENLTVKEHLEMFCVFKGVESNLINDEVNKAMEDMCLTDKKDFQAKGLSGGQKRKLSIALALIGGSEVVFLDEPSSGMDITSRRQLWDILKKCTNNRIIVLTTHYMEEAAVLGNRIGIMTSGKLKCSGSLLFLIDRYGQYISLNIIKNPDASNDNIIRFILEKIPDVEYEILSEEILFRIPKINTEISLKEFFSDLDKNLEKLRIKTYGASMPTLEDVYLNVASHKNLDVILPSKARSKKEINNEENKKKNNHNLVLKNGLDQNDNSDSNNNNSNDKKNEDKDFKQEIRVVNYDDYDPRGFPKITAGEKFWIDLNSSIRKRFIQILRDKKSFMLEIICPILLVLIGLLVSSVEFIKDSPTVKIEPSLLGLNEQKVYIYPNIFKSNQELPSLFLGDNKEVIIEKKSLSVDDKSDFTKILIDFNNLISPKNYTTDLNSYGSFLIADLNRDKHLYEFYVLANMQSKDSPLIFTQMMMNKIISYAANKPINIEFSNSPFPLTNKSKNQSSSRNSSNLVFFISIAFALIPANFITIIIKERELNTKHLQIISGISSSSYWFSNFIFELIKYYFTGGLCLLLIWGFDSYADYLYILYLLYGFSMVSFTYLLSFLFKFESTAQNFVILINFFFGALGGTIVMVLRFIEDTVSVGKALAFVFRLIPSFSFSYGYNQLLSIKLLYSIDYPDTYQKMKTEPLSMTYMGMDVLFLALEFFVYSLLLIICESKNTGFSCRGKNKGSSKADVNDSVVLKEIEKANLESEIEKNSVTVQNLEKDYSELCCGKSFKAVNNLSFCLQPGECFALLGVNGAGKTTTFKTLTCEHLPTSGKVYVNGEEITQNFNKIRNLIGYCPQFDAIFDYMTVDENLEFYAKIKGINKEIIPSIIDSLITELKLSKFKHDISGNLSGGNKRKLSVGIAMIGNPPIILLDEPSTGMDPEARRFMWSVIHKIASKGKKSSVILTTHSMEEAETLCRRMGIMVAGQFKCLGTSQYIKDKYGFGYEIDLRIKNIPERIKIEMLNVLQLPQEHLVDPNLLGMIFNSLGKSNFIQLLKDNHLGKSIKEELESKRKIPIMKVLDWIFYTENALKCLGKILGYFKDIYISEFWDNNYKIKIKKNNSNNSTIGFLFGLLEDQKTTCNLTEYSISQTTLEQIFNKFALESSKDGQENLNPDKNEIKIDGNILNYLSIEV